MTDFSCVSFLGIKKAAFGIFVFVNTVCMTKNNQQRRLYQ